MPWSEVSEQVIEYINRKLLLAGVKRRLSENEQLVLKAAWDDLSYGELAEEAKCTESYFRAGVSTRLWKILTEIIGKGQIVNKRSFRFFIELKLKTEGSLSVHERVNTDPIVLIGSPPEIFPFYGRQSELKDLNSTIQQHGVVVLYGVEGIGKTALAAKLLDHVRESPEEGFDYLIWKSIHYGPPLHDLVTELLTLVCPKHPELPESTQERVTLLIEHLRCYRTLLILDQAESLLQSDELLYRKEADGYESFLRRVAEDQSHSCVLLTSRDRFRDIESLEAMKRAVTTIKLTGLTTDDAIEFVVGKGLAMGDEWQELIQLYRGIPYVLDIVTSQVKKLFGGNVKDFYSYKTSLMKGHISKIFNCGSGGVNNLSGDDRKIIHELATNKNNLMSFQDLLKKLVSSEENISVLKLKNSIERLVSISIIELQTDSKTGEELYSVNPLVLKYVLKEQFASVPAS